MNAADETAEWRRIFDSIADPIYVIDNAFHLKKINKSLAGLAMKAADLPGEQSCYSYLFDRNTVCPWCPVPQKAEKQASFTVEAPLFTGKLWQIQSFPDVNGDQERLGWINVMRDITVLKKIQEQWIESEKLASTGKLISGVAHEVRNPLFGISTTARALANELGNKEEIKPYLGIIMSETARLNRLMDDLLNYSRPAQIDKNPSDIVEVAREVVQHYHQLAENKKIILNLFPSENIPPINMDRNKIKQVLINLVENAIEHVDGIPRIDFFIEFVSLTKPPEIQVVVKDNGSGIAPEHLQRIFDPFFTTRKKGTGLGLSIVRKVIHDHKGRITVESHVGSGTIFRVSLPVAAAV